MKFINAEGIEKVSQAVAQAEKRTSGEIVPMIVQRSSMIGHVPLQLLSLWVIFLFVLHSSFEYWIYNFMSPWWYVAIGVLAAPVVLLTSRLSFVQRALVSAGDEEFQVFTRAQIEFGALKMQNTVDRTGILIFVSLMERRCVVLADQGIATKLPPTTWDGVVAQVIAGIKSGDPAAGLTRAIETCGELLAQHFPAKADDKNELPNTLVMKE